MSEELFEEPDNTRRMDPELRTMGQMLRVLGEMEEGQVRRVLAYLNARYWADHCDPSTKPS